tara:strand:+ start:1185 stop:1892 length:708 start_codon:yes stop_codon:yes gene_type:complete
MALYGTGSNVNQTTDVSAGNYGSGNAIPVITVDSDKRISAINTSSVTYATLNANATVGSVGSYAFMQQASGNTQYAPGDTLAGSDLRYSDATGRVHTDTPTGNWRCMGYDSGAALTNSGTVGGSAAGSGTISGNVEQDSVALSGATASSSATTNVTTNTNVNTSGNIQGGKGNLSLSSSGTSSSSATTNVTTNVGGNVDTSNMNVGGNCSVNVNLASITVNTTVAYSATLWLRYA